MSIDVPFKIPVRKIISNTKVCSRCRLFCIETIPVLNRNLRREMRRRGYPLPMVKLECRNGCHLKFPGRFLDDIVVDFALKGGKVFEVKDWGNRGRS